jgi:micrococcal nuclease
MVLDGYAVKFTIKPNDKYAHLIKQAERNARQEKKGIWGEQGLKEMPVKYRERHPRTSDSL